MLTGLQVVVGDMAAVDLLDGVDVDRGLEVVLRTNGGNLWLGGPGVTSSTGYNFIPNNDGIRFRLHGDTIYAISGSGNVTAYVLVVGQK